MRVCWLLLSLWTAPLCAADAPFLWKFEGAKATHHFVGSVHLLPTQAGQLPPALLRAVDDSATLIFETDIEALESPQMQTEMLAAASSKIGLKAEVGDALYQRLKKQLTKAGLPELFCASFRAWFCAMTLEVTGFVREGFQPELGIDQQLNKRAKQQGKARRGLETLEQHLGLFTGMTTKMSVEFLAATLDEMEQGELSPKVLLDIWQSNDLAAIAKMTGDMKAEHPLAYERLLAGRNRAWLPQLDEMLRRGEPVLVVVGAAHFAGPDGLLALLKARGFALQPLKG